MPPSTPVPIECRLPEPAPVLIASGSTPSMNAAEVITIGRRRWCAADSVASIRPMPLRCSSCANSTIRMAFFADRPIVVSSPTWKYTSFSSPRSSVAVTAPMTPSGTTSSTANGIDQLSYSAASARNTTSTDTAYRYGACEPDWRSCRDRPVHS